MIWSIAAFEIQKSLRQLSTYVYFAIFFAMAFLIVIAAGGAFKSVSVGMGTGGKIMINSPFTLLLFISILSHFGLLITAAIMGQAVYQDFAQNTFPFLFTVPIRPSQYICGRFLGAFLIVLGIFASIGLGCWFGSLMPFLDQRLIGSNRFAAFIQPYFVSVAPNVLFTGALFFGLAALKRKILPVYVGSVLLLIGYLIAASLTVKIENKFMASLLDPFGMGAIEHLTEYWTVTERNTQLVPLAGVFLYNRLIWIAAGVAMLGFTILRFRFVQGGVTGRLRVVAEAAGESAPTTVAVTPAGGTQGKNPVALLTELTWLAFRETVKNIYFVVIVLAGVLFIVFASQATGSIFGTKTYPVTGEVLELAGGSFTMFMLIIITFYSGELVWRERDAGVHQLCDVLPIPNWLPFVSKLGALVLVQVLLMAVVMLTGIGIQAAEGYSKFEFGLYVRDLFGIKLVHYCLLAMLAMTVHTVVNHKYVGHFLMVLYYVATAFLGRFGFEHHLYKYATDPGYTYSDMNGFGHFIRGIVWFDLYWAACAVLLAIVTNLFWVRGLDLRGRRFGLARARFTRSTATASAVSVTVFVALGVFIFRNTNILNDYKTSYDNECEAADYERQYKQHEHAPQPRVTDAKVVVDLFPEKRQVRATGTYQLANKTARPISTVFINVPSRLTIHQLAVGPARDSSKSDGRLGFYTFDLPDPLTPGSTLPLEFDLEYAARGFANNDGETFVVYNGTFLNSELLPHVGYRAARELSDDSTRRKHGFEPKERMADVNDVEARRNNYISSDADWVTLDATVSTSPDQIAIVPGYLEREWQENGRRYFQYKTDGKVLHFFSVLSARYELKRDHWAASGVGSRFPEQTGAGSAETIPLAQEIPVSAPRSGNDVAIEIYYHRGHEYNIDRMIESIKASLDYFTTNFSPYQHRQVRIIEFPRYATFAQSFPNTIPYSEGIGFIAKVNPKDPEDVDYPFYVTAHEVAHQWWAHQVIGGNVQGSEVLSETLAQYSALMVMKKTFGPDQMKRFLRYELNRYLIGRSFERKKELPLIRVEHQPYIYYNKGSLVMYALQDMIGEEALNRALASYIQAVAFQEPPYTNSLEFLEQIRRVTPDELQYILKDMFETITLYNNRAVSATYQEVGNGEYEVRLNVQAQKVRADELGAETEVPLGDLIDIGVLGADEKPIYLEKHWIRESPAEFTIRVSKLPAKAGIDPMHKLIDRLPDDNVVRVEKK